MHVFKLGATHSIAEMYADPSSISERVTTPDGREFITDAGYFNMANMEF
jgi:hypothetical protein